MNTLSSDNTIGVIVNKNGEIMQHVYSVGFIVDGWLRITDEENSNLQKGSNIPGIIQEINKKYHDQLIKLFLNAA